MVKKRYSMPGVRVRELAEVSGNTQTCIVFNISRLRCMLKECLQDDDPDLEYIFGNKVRSKCR